MQMTDLYEDIKDGICLLSLLEVLTGEELVNSSTLAASVGQWSNCSPCVQGPLFQIIYTGF